MRWCGQCTWAARLPSTHPQCPLCPHSAHGVGDSETNLSPLPGWGIAGAGLVLAHHHHHRYFQCAGRATQRAGTDQPGWGAREAVGSLASGAAVLQGNPAPSYCWGRPLLPLVGARHERSGRDCGENALSPLGGPYRLSLPLPPPPRSPCGPCSGSLFSSAGCRRGCPGAP